MICIKNRYLKLLLFTKDYNKLLESLYVCANNSLLNQNSFLKTL